MYMPVRRRMCSSEERVLILLSSYVALPLAWPLVAVLAIGSMVYNVERAALSEERTRLADSGRDAGENRSIEGEQGVALLGEAANLRNSPSV